LKNILYLLVFNLILVATSCKEIPPAIDFTPINTSLTDTTYISTTIPVAQHKKIILEEFTGMKCVNCPTGHALSKLLHDAHPDSVIVVAIHSYPILAPSSWGELQINEGIAIDNLLGPAPSWPSSSIDRTPISGNTIVLSGNWTNAIENKLGEATSVNVEISNTYDSAPISTDSGTVTKLKTKIKVIFTNAVTTSMKLSVMLQENGIIAPQETPTGVNMAYVHEFTLRDMFTPYNGVSLSQTNIAGRTYEKEFEMYIPIGWNMNASHVVAIVHEEGTGNKVLQANIEVVN
jgi:hypothetical protein